MPMVAMIRRLSAIFRKVGPIQTKSPIMSPHGPHSPHRKESPGEAAPARAHGATPRIARRAGSTLAASAIPRHTTSARVTGAHGTTDAPACRARPRARPGSPTTTAPQPGRRAAHPARPRGLPRDRAQHLAAGRPGPSQHPGSRRPGLKDRIGDVTEFMAASERVAGGGMAVDPEVTRPLSARRRDPPARVTPREREVLAPPAEGRCNAAVARAWWSARRRRQAHREHPDQAESAARGRRSSAGIGRSDVFAGPSRLPVGCRDSTSNRTSSLSMSIPS